MPNESDHGKTGRALLAEADAAAKESDWMLAAACAKGAGEEFARAARLASGGVVGHYENTQ